jgi:hypothetical protein
MPGRPPGEVDRGLHGLRLEHPVLCHEPREVFDAELAESEVLRDVLVAQVGALLTSVGGRSSSQ